MRALRRLAPKAHLELHGYTLGFEVPEGVAPGDEFEVAIDLSTLDPDVARAVDADGDGALVSSGACLRAGPSATLFGARAVMRHRCSYCLTVK